MFDNWFKSWEDMYSYKTFKQTINNYNQKVINFWKDAIEDITVSKKKDND